MGRLTNRPADSPEVDAECKEITYALEEERAIGSGTYADCFKNTHLRNGLRTWTGIMLQGWQQLTGINFIFYVCYFASHYSLQELTLFQYGTTFFQSAGIGNPFIITLVHPLSVPTYLLKTLLG
jgi:hypothetical protein